jgi:hypothetical protein
MIVGLGADGECGHACSPTGDPGVFVLHLQIYTPKEKDPWESRLYIAKQKQIIVFPGVRGHGDPGGTAGRDPSEVTDQGRHPLLLRLQAMVQHRQGPLLPRPPRQG